VGGACRNIGAISRMLRNYSLDVAHNYQVQRAEFISIYDMIRVLDPDKRAKIRGMSAGRADIFVSALACVKGLLNVIPFPYFTISGCGMREGIMLSYATPTTLEKPISDILGHSLTTLTLYFDENQKHADQVYNLSMQLFKQLRVLHKLPRQYVKVLRVAAILHDAGMRIKYYGHHKHSFYIIINSNLYGLTHRELVLAAFVAAAHYRDGFQLSEWNRYKDLTYEEDLVAARKMGVILRIAESLDRSMSSGVKTIYCDVLGDSVILKTEVEGDCSLEIQDAMTAAPEFAKSFRKNLEIL
jgi:exopolyphosphatase/guanosine-5'-triphosphate,3'-diphosphate pyrophosphatase